MDGYKESDFNFPAWRAFRLLEGKPLLASLTNNSKALPRITSPRVGSKFFWCGDGHYYKYFGPVSKLPSHKVPEPTMGNPYGFWGFKSVDDLIFQSFSTNQAAVFSQVAFGGTIIEHELGYRATEMLIWRIFLLEKQTKSFIDHLERRYQCPVLDFKCR